MFATSPYRFPIRICPSKHSLTFPQFRGHPVKSQPTSPRTRRGVVAKCGVPTSPIREHFDVRNDVLSRLVPCAILARIGEFTLEYDEEALHAGIVPVVAGAAHARGYAVRVEQTLVARGGILTAAIRVVQEPIRGGPVRERYGEGTLGQIHGQMVAHRLADHAARVQIEHDGEIGQT